jgi:hypothetical protein
MLNKTWGYLINGEQFLLVIGIEYREILIFSLSLLLRMKKKFIKIGDCCYFKNDQIGYKYAQQRINSTTIDAIF